MKKSIPSKIFQISLLISIYAGSIFSSQSNDEKNTPQPATEHIWSISGENPNFSRENIQQVLKKGPTTPKIIDRPTKQNESNSEWESGWDDPDEDYDPSNENDLDLFFPPSEEDAPKYNEKKPTVAPAPKEPNHLYPIQNDKTKTTSTSPIIKAVSHLKKDETSSPKFAENTAKGWTHEGFQPGNAGDISNAQFKGSSVIFYAPEEEQNLSTNLQEHDRPENNDETSTSLGKKHVSVTPYITPIEEQKAPIQASQPVQYSKFAPTTASFSESKQGLFGPISPELTEKPLTEKTRTKPNPDEIIAQVINQDASIDSTQQKTTPKTILINFNNVAVIEYIRFISRLTNKNFVFDETDLQFNVTIISEEPTSIDNVLTALIQELRIHGLALIEEGNNFLIHQNDNGSTIARINTDEAPTEVPRISELVTQVFRLNTLAPLQAQSILTPLLSKQAIIGISNESRHLIITDLVTNIQKVEKLLKNIDAPNSGFVLGQYVVRNAFIDNLIELAKQIMAPIAQDQKLSLIPHPAAKSIFIVSSPFIVERTISVLQHLDNFEGTTRIYDLEDLKFQATIPTNSPEEVPGAGKWELDRNGNWIFRTSNKNGTNQQPEGDWLLDAQKNWFYSPKGAPRTGELPSELPHGQWKLDPQGSWIFQLSPGENTKPQSLTRGAKSAEELPLGHIDRTKFFIYKLQYRKGEDIVKALSSIAHSLQKQGNSNIDLISTIDSAQWLETSNSIIITGVETSIAKVKELIEEIDQPQRQVMIEMLILDTTIADALTYGVSWGSRSGGGSTSTSQAFIGGGSPLVAALAGTGTTSTPDASGVATTVGYNLGMIGQRLTHNGTQFASIGALVNAIHTLSQTNIILNPKIITEDNKPAEIFVGLNTPFLSNSIANDQGSIVTTNVEFKDTGTTLQVTPLIGYGNVITLDIKQEVSNVQSSPNAGGSSTTTVNLTPTTSIERTSTTVHVPDRNFVVMSGFIQDEKDINNNQFPCLGGIPLIGAAFKTTEIDHTKRNLMIFIRVEIIKTDEDFREITKKQQQIYKQKNRMKKSWKYETEQALDFMNIKPDCCDECD